MTKRIRSTAASALASASSRVAPSGEQGAGPVGRTAEGAEDVAGLAVDAREGDAAQPLRQLDRLEGSRRRREEAQGGSSGPGVEGRRDLGRRQGPAECRCGSRAR